MDFSSDEEDSEEQNSPASQNIVSISQSFKRSTTMEEISNQIIAVSSSNKPIHVNFLAGSIQGNLAGNLKVVQSGLSSFLKTLQSKPIEKLVITTGKQKGTINGKKCQWASVKNILQAEKATGGFLGLGRQAVSGNSLILASALTDQSYLQELTIGARLKKVDCEALAKSLEKARSIQLKTLQLTNVCLSDEAVNAFSRFFHTQTFDRLLLSHRTETIHQFAMGLCADTPSRIKDNAMGELIKSLSTSASQSLKHIHLAHLKIHSNANAEALGQLLSRKAVMLETIALEGMFGKRKLTDLCFQKLNRLQSKDTLEEFSCRQADMTDTQMYQIATCL